MESNVDPKQEDKDSHDVMTVAELAKILRLNSKTVYEAIANKEIPGCRRVGRKIIISKRTVLNWLHG